MKGGRHVLAAGMNPAVGTAFIASAVAPAPGGMARTAGPDGWLVCLFAYQQEIGLRHERAKKNETDRVKKEMLAGSMSAKQRVTRDGTSAQTLC
jgi:hypothetical protein